MPTDIAPEILKLLSQVRQAVQDYDDIEEHFAWNWRCFYRELRGRNFLYANEKKDYLEVLVRLPLTERRQALELPFVEEPKSMGRGGWLVALVKTPEQLEIVKPWIKVSYDLSKPFRTTADCLPGENPLALELYEQVRQFAHNYGDIEEYFPFSERAFRNKAKGKGQIFLYTSEAEENLYVTVRLPMIERANALELDYVEVPKYLGPKGWVTARINSPEQLETAKTWIQISYELNQPARKPKAKK